MAPSQSVRLDANDQYFLSAQLQSLDETKYYHLVPGVVGRKILPVVPGVSPNLPVYRFSMIKLRGNVAKGGSRSKGQPTVSVVRTEETQQIKTYEAAMAWTIDDVRASREAGTSLPEDTQMAAVAKLEQQIDTVLAVGDTIGNIPGLTNNASISTTNGAALWLSAATSDQMIGDVSSLVSSTQDALKQGMIPGSEMPFFDQFALYLPVKHMTKLMTTRIGATNDISVLRFIRENFEMIKAIRPWHRLDTANGGNPMGVLVPALDNGAMNPFAGGAILPLDFEALPEQYDGRNVTVPCAAKCGGVVIRYPVGCRYLKSI